jgi:uncharacterized membrane protein
MWTTQNQFSQKSVEWFCVSSLLSFVATYGFLLCIRVMERFQKYVKILAQNVRMERYVQLIERYELMCFPIAALQLYRSRDLTGVCTMALSLDNT